MIQRFFQRGPVAALVAVRALAWRDAWVACSRRLVGLFGWLLLLGPLGAILFHVATPSEPDAESSGEPVHDGPVWSVVFGPGDAYLASSAITGDLRIQNLATAQVRRLIVGPVGSGASLAFAPDGRTFGLAGAGPELRQWDLDSGNERDALATDKRVTRSVAYSPDGSLVAVGTYTGRDLSSEVVLFDCEGRRVAALDSLPSGVNLLAFSPDGATLAVCDASGQALLWDVAARRERARFRLSTSQPRSLGFFPDGTRVATYCDFQLDVELWDAGTGEPRGKLAVPGPGATTVALSPGGNVMAFAGRDGVARLCAVAGGRMLGAVGQSGPSLYSVAFTHDGRRLATGGADGSVRIWDVSDALASGRPHKHGARFLMRAPGVARSRVVSPSPGSGAAALIFNLTVEGAHLAGLWVGDGRRFVRLADRF